MNMPWIICHKDKTTSARRWLIGIGLLLYHSEKGTFLKYLIRKNKK